MEFIPIEKAMQELGVDRSTWYYYKNKMQFTHHKFPLDKRRYISAEDFDQLKRAVNAAHNLLQTTYDTWPELLENLARAIEKYPPEKRLQMANEAISRLEKTAAAAVLEKQNAVAK